MPNSKSRIRPINDDRGPVSNTSTNTPEWSFWQLISILKKEKWVKYTGLTENPHRLLA